MQNQDKLKVVHLVQLRDYIQSYYANGPALEKENFTFTCSQYFITLYCCNM